MRCRQSCASDDTCAADERCTYGACLPVGASCGAASDCLGIEVCVAGSCRLTCHASTDCLADQDCVGGICTPRDQPGLDAAGRDGAVIDTQTLDDTYRSDTQHLTDASSQPDSAPPFDAAQTDLGAVTTDSAQPDTIVAPLDGGDSDLFTPGSDAAVADAWTCSTVPCSSTDRCCNNGCALPGGTVCGDGYCNGGGTCIRCFENVHCSDDDPCTNDFCLTDNSCDHSSALASITRNTVWGTDGFCENGATLGFQRVEAICSNQNGELMNSRGFLSFDSSVVPTDATVVSAALTICRTGGPGAQLAELYTTSFALNLSCDAYNSQAFYLQILPDGSGPFTVNVIADAVTHGGNTQFQIRYPVTDCAVGTWYGKRWRSATGPIDGTCDEDDAPRLDVSYCTAPY